jgi:hypothetical protein
VVKPGSVCGSPGECHVVFLVSSPPKNTIGLVGREIVQDDINAFSPGVSPSQELENRQGLPRALARPEVSPENILVNVQEAEEVTHTVWTCIGGRLSVGMA